MTLPASYRFGPFMLDPGRRLLLDGGAPVSLGSRAFDVLVALVEGRDHVVGKHELFARVWPGAAVEQNNLTVHISALRKALRETPDGARYIGTVSGRGYRFIGDVEPTPPSPSAPPSPAPRLAPIDSECPTIAVLPFRTTGCNPAQEHLGHALAEDLTAELSRNRWLTVIARSSSVGLPPDALQPVDAARLLGVRYVLDGSVRTAGHRVRVTVQLTDAATGQQLLSERFERDYADIFDMQDEITRLSVAAVRPALYEAEQARSIRRRPESVDAWSAYQRGIWQMSLFEDPACIEARPWFERAIALDPQFAPGYYGLALAYLHDGSGFVPGTVADWQARGEALALKAVEMDPRDSGAYSVLGTARMVRGDHEGSLVATGQALALNPSDAAAHGTEGATLVFSGRMEEGLRALATSLRLSPRDPRLRIRHAHIGLGHYFARDYVAAEAQAHAIMRDWPACPFGPRLLALVLAETGRPDAAAAAIRQAMALSPAPFDDYAHARMPWYRPADHARVIAAMRRAGWKGAAG